MEKITMAEAVSIQNKTLNEIQEAANGIKWLLRDLPDFADKNILVKTVAAQAGEIASLAYQMRHGYKE